MRVFLRVLQNEALKIRRTLALWMVLVAPLVIALLSGLIGYGGGERLASGGNAWPQITRNAIGLWTLLMLPLFITLETSLLAGLEHTDRHWKHLLALPAPRWTVYVSKLLVVVAMLWTAHAMLAGLMLVAGVVLRALQPALALETLPLDPLVRPLLRISGAALFGVAIQHWVSPRWQSHTAALGFGMCATIIGFVAANDAAWGRWIPWSMPIHAAGLPRTAVNPLTVAIAGALVVAALGTWHFSRREIA